MSQYWAPDRRSILKALGLAVAAETLPTAAFAQANKVTLNCFLEESGMRGSFPLVIGALTTGEAERHVTAIGALRKEYKYRRALSFASNDRHKGGFANAVIEYFAGARGLHFAALVVTDDGMRWRRQNLEAKDAIYFDAYKKLLANIRYESGKGAMLRVRYRAKKQRDAALHEFLLLPSSAPIQAPELALKHESPDDEDLAQLGQFLAGCVRADLVGATLLKIAPLMALKRLFGVGSLENAPVARLSVTTMRI